MTTGKKVLIGGGVLALLLALGAVGARGRSGKGVEIRMAEVSTKDLVATVTASGNVRARRSVDISADISARVTALLIDEGDDVVEGQVLLRLEPSQYQAAVDRSRAGQSRAQAGVSQARANFRRAEREYDRMLGLRNRDSLLVSLQDVENAETNLDVQRSMLESSEFSVAESQAALSESQDRLAKTIIRAPIAGKVTRLNVEQGETVVLGTMNNAGSLILTISDLSIMEVVLEVDETDVPEIAIGDSAMVDLDAFPDLAFRGTVTEIGNSAIRPPSAAAAGGQTPTIDFEVVVTLHDPPASLRPDLSATADVITEVRSDQMSIPIIALTVRQKDRSKDDDDDDDDPGAPTRRDDGPVARAASDEPEEGVFVVTNGEVTFVPVVVGIAGQEFFEVLSGLSLGDTVVSGPYQTIRGLEDGDKVKPIETGDAGSN